MEEEQQEFILRPDDESLIFAILPICAFLFPIILILLISFITGVNSCDIGKNKSILIAPFFILALLSWHIHKLIFFKKKGLLCINKEGIFIPYIGLIKWSEIDKVVYLEYSKLTLRGEYDFLCIIPKDYETILSRLKPVRKRDIKYRAKLFGIKGICIHLLGCSSNSSLDNLCQQISHFFELVDKKVPTLSGLFDI